MGDAFSAKRTTSPAAHVDPSTACVISQVVTRAVKDALTQTATTVHQTTSTAPNVFPNSNSPTDNVYNVTKSIASNVVMITIFAIYPF